MLCHSQVVVPGQLQLLVVAAVAVAVEVQQPRRRRKQERHLLYDVEDVPNGVKQM